MDFAEVRSAPHSPGMQMRAPKFEQPTYFISAQQIAQGIQPCRDEHRAMMIRTVIHDLICRARDVDMRRETVSILRGSTTA